VDIDIYSDVVCPWCYIGTARLRAALATFPGEAILRWRPFLVDPDRLGTDPGPASPGLRSAGSEATRGPRDGDALSAQGPARAERAQRGTVNSFDALRLLWFADRPEAVAFGATADTQPELADRLHRAHFRDGLDVAAPDVLTALAVEVGLDSAPVRRMLESDEGTPEVREEIEYAHSLGITAVPTFVFDGRYAVVGAHDADRLRAVLDDLSGRPAEPGDHDGPG